MAKGVHDLGNDFGFIYVVNPDNTKIIQAYPNNERNAREVRLDGLRATSVALNQSPFGQIKVETITGAGSITDITIDGNSQINANISYTGATALEDLASDIAAAINSSNITPALDYTAYSSGALVYVKGVPDIGSDHNGVTPIVTTTGNSTYIIGDINGGSDSNNIYNESYGYRFFLDADYDTSGCSGAGSATENSTANAVEITDYIVPRHLNSAIPGEEETIADGAITYTRSSVITKIDVETESSAATDDLDTIGLEGVAEGDIIILTGNHPGRVTTVKDGTGNINLENSVDFETGGREKAIMLQYTDNGWYELSRSSQSIGDTSAYRAAKFGFFGLEEFNTQVVATSGTTTFDGGTSEKYQEITGSDTLAGNTDYDLGTGVAGDEFYLEYNASVTTSGNNLSIFGITLTDEQALNGGLIFRAKYLDTTGWESYVTPNLSPSIAFPYTIPTELLKNGAVTVAKVETSLKTDLITAQISWDTNRIGDHKLVIPFACTVNQIDVYVDDLIEATDDADVNFKDNGGLSMSSITLNAADTIGTGYSDTPSSNNTFTAGQVLTMTTTKSTAGGNAKVSIKVTKT